jgi:hypothetical protein
MIHPDEYHAPPLRVAHERPLRKYQLTERQTNYGVTDGQRYN